MTEEINIDSGGRVISRVVAGETVGEVHGLLGGEREVFMVYDRNVEAYALKLKGFMRGSMPLTASEEVKDMETVLHICSWLMASGADRDALLLAVGGGITSDMAGFAANIYKRGIRFAYVPTTLLAQVDAAIGGKTGVNFEGYKNMLGVIRQPEFTYLCPDVLVSLPRRDFLSGAAELLKTFIINNSSASYAPAVTLLRQLSAKETEATGKAGTAGQMENDSQMTGHSKEAEATSQTGTAGQGQTAVLATPKASAAEDGGIGPTDSAPQKSLRELIFAAAAVKASVVGRDQFEKGERRKLNLGHTFAHAIEHQARLTGADITHGEAVAMGIIMAAHAADRLWSSCHDRPSNLERRLRTDFKACGLPVDSPFGLPSIAEAMGKDKKATDGGFIHFILPYDIGDVRTADLSVAQIIELQ